MVHVPVVAAARLEGHVVRTQLRVSKRREPAAPDEVLGIGVVGLAHGEDVREPLWLIDAGGADLLVLAPDLLDHAENGPALGPATVHGRVRHHGHNLVSTHTVSLGVCQVVRQRCVGDSRGHERGHGHDALGLDVDGLLVPYLPKQHVVVEVRKEWGDGAQLVSACGLLHGALLSFSTNDAAVQARSTMPLWVLAMHKVHCWERGASV